MRYIWMGWLFCYVKVRKQLYSLEEEGQLIVSVLAFERLKTVQNLQIDILSQMD